MICPAILKERLRVLGFGDFSVRVMMLSVVSLSIVLIFRRIPPFSKEISIILEILGIRKFSTLSGPSRSPNQLFS